MAFKKEYTTPYFTCLTSCVSNHVISEKRQKRNVYIIICKKQLMEVRMTRNMLMMVELCWSSWDLRLILRLLTNTVITSSYLFMAIYIRFPGVSPPPLILASANISIKMIIYLIKKYEFVCMADFIKSWRGGVMEKMIH